MAKKKTTSKKKDDLSFEQAIENLTGIVEKIETGQVSLAESLSQFETGMGLIKHCRKILLDAEKRIEKISEEEQDETEADEHIDDVDDEESEGDSLF